MIQVQPRQIVHERCSAIPSTIKETLQLHQDALTFQVPFEVRHELKLLVNGKTADNRLEDGADSDVVLANEAAVVHIGEYTHEEPAWVHALAKYLLDMDRGVRRTGSPFGQSYRRDRGCCGRSP